MIPGARAVRRAAEPVYLLCRQGKRNGHVTLRSSVLSPSARATLVIEEQDIDVTALDLQLAELEQATRGPLSALDNFGETLARTVLSPQVRTELLRSSDRHLVVVHDEASSRIPWETLRLRADGRRESWAPAQAMGLSHRLESSTASVATWPEQKRYQPGIHILLIVDPTRNLEGAVKEGQRLMEIASQTAGITVKKLLQGQATLEAVLKELRSGEYDVVHYAGHAFFDESAPEDSGLVLADGNLLGCDLAKILSLPSLVFFNACEAARVRSDGHETVADPATPRGARVQQSLGVAEALLRGGVANFLGTYWPVNDTAASQFSAQFYQALLAGSCLGDAIQEGRHAVQKAQSSDWADYVFYGSHDFNLKIAGA